MCGRFASFLPAATVQALFGTIAAIPYCEPSWSIAPTNAAMVVCRNPDTGERQLDLLRWGLMSPWSAGPDAPKPAPVNARCETAASSGVFRRALASRRCIVPANAFYEWRTEPGGKQPFAVARADGDMLALAGLWEGWRSPDGRVVRTFCILTCAANAAMRPLHERMPVVLERPDWAAWLGNAAAARELMRPAGTDVLKLWPVSQAVDFVRNNGPELLEAVTGPAAPPPTASRRVPKRA